MSSLIRLALSMALLLSSCTQTAPHVQAGNDLIKSVIKSVKKTDNLRLLGSGGSFYEDVKMFSFYFYSFRKLNIDEARMMLLDNVEQVLTLINSDKKLLPFLHTYPFTHKNIEFSILFYEQNRLDKFINPPNIALAYSMNGLIYYTVYNTSKNDLDDVHGESYQRAKGIVEHQRNLFNIPSGIDWQ